ncbi:hypothetical protein SAMN05216559_3377 [Halomicrobium zhouii]|uniref:Uncharacterized protein n=1 Tax=Halomicrobium zhouii TaxID=767519 RepID=A0A1I6LXQ9_9EURY|nr:hypothetical protein [Halomicrobium zhouii]SFS08210.1 hypothetical protein SAMN05216559_3377 [Halomicrobium zhouii]
MTDPETLDAAVDEVRREGYKAAAVFATADAVLALLVVNVGLTVVAVDVPSISALPVGTEALISAVVGLAVGVASGVVRARRYGVERFEAANPELGAALRSARDAAHSAHDDTMARRLYADALDRLKDASSGRLLDERRLALRMAVVFVLAVGSIHVTVAGVALDPLADSPTVGGSDGSDSDQGPDDPQPDSSESLDSDPISNTDGSDVLGDPGEVARGDEALTANLSDRSGSGAGDERARYENAGHPSAGDISPERAGYDDPGSVEDPELVREYTLRMNEANDDD